jgi:hypothetical protein
MKDKGSNRPLSGKMAQNRVGIATSAHVFPFANKELPCEAEQGQNPVLLPTPPIHPLLPIVGNERSRTGHTIGTLAPRDTAVHVWNRSPIHLPVMGGHYDVWLIEAPHRLPGRNKHWSSMEAGTSRLWFFCMGCRRKVANLFYYYLAPGSPTRSDLLCRVCHRLTYVSVNSGGNRWYREVARPIKRWLREKRMLLARQDRPRVSARLAQIDSELGMLRYKVKTPSKCGTQILGYGPGGRKRRPYRNLALLEQ